MPLANLRQLSDHNDLGHHKRIDQSKGKGQTYDVKFAQQEHAVRREGAKEKGQVQGKYNQLLELVEGLLLQAWSGRTFIIHHFAAPRVSPGNRNASPARSSVTRRTASLVFS